ncbi:MAG: serine--tRNA ligase, partial [Paludibacteraceae bacterium]|nr:serine--tRNA ligase [Paludibacteraceae bacterium]
MLTLKYITENFEDAVARLQKKHFEGREILSQVVDLDNDRKKTQAQLDSTLNQIKTQSAKVGELFKKGMQQEAGQIREEVAKLKTVTSELEQQMKDDIDKITNLLLTVPNIPNDTVPEGFGAEDNKVEKMGGNIPE